MPFTRLALLMCYVIVAAGITVLLFTQLGAGGLGAQAMPALLPLAMLAALAIRALQKRLPKDDG